MLSNRVLQPLRFPEAPRHGRLVVEMLSWIAHNFGLVDSPDWRCQGYGTGSEFHRGSSFFFAGRFKERFFLESEHSRDNYRGEYLDLRIQLCDAVIVKLPCISDAIFRAGQFLMQRNKVLV